MSRRFSMLSAAAILVLTGSSAALAVDTPSIEMGASGHAKQQMTVTAGPSGTPDGFTVYWMLKSDFDANGGVWPDGMVGVSYSAFRTHPTLNTFDGEVTTFRLAANQSAIVEIGDLLDESGVSSNDRFELLYDTDYVFTVAAFGSTVAGATLVGRTTESQNCTYTFGYWKNHPEAWPTSSLSLGCVNYTQAQLLSILGQAVKGNGLVSL